MIKLGIHQQKRYFSDLAYLDSPAYFRFRWIALGRIPRYGAYLASRHAGFFNPDFWSPPLFCLLLLLKGAQMSRGGSKSSHCREGVLRDFGFLKGHFS